MDMPVLRGAGRPGCDPLEKLGSIAELLGCPPETFFQADTTPTIQTARLVQMWSRVTRAGNREVIFRFACEVLKAEREEIAADGK